MKYKNPVLSGMYPDPSVCYVDGHYYLVNSTFEYMPGVPVFESTDLVNWTQIGNCIVNGEAIGMDDCPCSGGIFAPTLRWHNDQFYMITTCFGKNGLKNFYITAKEAKGPWSEPKFVEIDGIDPSFYWENGKTYIQYTDYGIIRQVEIDEETQKIIDGPCVLTTGCGGRFAEGPHMWKRNGYYYLLLAEGGTTEGHMVTLMRGESVWGPFEPSPYLPVISNKDYAFEPLQCVGHADWITDAKGNDYLMTLGCRYVNDKTVLGRETMLTSAYWTEDGWLRAELDYMPVEAENTFAGEQKAKKSFHMDMAQKELPLNVISPRKRHDEKVLFVNEKMSVTGNQHTLNEEADQVLLGIRQSEYVFDFETEVTFEAKDETQEAGIVVYADCAHHFSLFVTKREDKNCLIFRKKVDEIEIETLVCEMASTSTVKLFVSGDEKQYSFAYQTKEGQKIEAGWTYIKHLANCCTGSQNTGSVIGVYVVGECTADFTEYKYDI